MKSNAAYLSEHPLPVEPMSINTTSSQTIAKPIVVCSVVGTAFEEDHWQVECPDCQKEFEYKGYFDSGDITKCKCGTSFKTSKLEFENGSYIE